MKKVAILIAFSMTLPAVAAAETVISLSQAINIALQQNHILKAATYQQQASLMEEKIAAGSYLPKVYLEETIARTNSPTGVFMMKLNQGRFTTSDFEISNINSPRAYHDFGTALRLEQVLFDRSLIHSQRLANIDLEVSEVNVEARRQDTALQVYRAFLDVRRARAYQSAARLAVNEAGEHVRLSSVRTQAGTGLKSDGLRARSVLYDAEQQEITANNDLSLAKMRLAMAIGIPDEEFEIEDTILSLRTVWTLEELKGIARSNRSDLNILKRQYDKTAVRADAARADFIPTVYAHASYQLNDRSVPFLADNQSWNLGFNLKWELFSGMRTINQVQKVKKQGLAAAENVADLLSVIDYQIAEALLRHQEAAKKLETANHAILDAEEVVRLVSTRYQNALSTMAELLDAQAALSKARANRVEMESGKALAAARIYQAAGIFLAEVTK